jgi:hypothetical protein
VGTAQSCRRTPPDSVTAYTSIRSRRRSRSGTRRAAASASSGTTTANRWLGVFVEWHSPQDLAIHRVDVKTDRCRAALRLRIHGLPVALGGHVNEADLAAQPDPPFALQPVAEGIEHASFVTAHVRILTYPWLPDRVAETVVLLVAVLVERCSCWRRASRGSRSAPS